MKTEIALACWASGRLDLVQIFKGRGKLPKSHDGAVMLATVKDLEAGEQVQTHFCRLDRNPGGGFRLNAIPQNVDFDDPATQKRLMDLVLDEQAKIAEFIETHKLAA